MERFGRSLDARYLRALGVPGRPVPAQGYLAPYLAELTATILAEVGERYRDLPAEQRLEALTQQGRDETVRRQRETLARFGVRFDDWYSEQELYDAGKLDRALTVLRESGHTYEADGALWLRTSDLGDAEDFPLLRSNGQPAYLAGDLAYHLDKFSRGFERVVDVWGPDHALYVRRTKAGVRALGHDPAALDIVIFQPVAIKVHETIIEDGGPAGNNFALDEVLEQVGPATARLLYLSRPATAPLDLDLDLARDESPASPAFRLLRTRDRLAELTSGAAPDTNVDLTALDGARDRELMRALARFPDEVRGAARALDSYPVMRYLQELTTLVEELAAGDPGAQAPARAALIKLANVVFANSLRVLGVPAE
jgi:arginyl-tRNA synthetase